MNSLILDSKNDNELKQAGEILANNGLVAIPTETVYGLAANALSPTAVKNIYKAKGRPSDNPLIVHIDSFEKIYNLVKFIPEKAKLLADKFWPGPLTIILPKSDIIPAETSGGLDTVAIRIPSDEVARKIINFSNCPLAAPSANISGKPSPTTFTHVYEDMNGKIEAIVKADDCNVGLESTVITFCTVTPKILRPGAVSAEEIRKIIGDVEIDRAVLTHLENTEKVASPGMKYKHYSPKADIIMSKLSFEDYKKLLNSEPNTAALCFNEDENEISNVCISYGSKYNDNEQAQKLFSALHKLDELNITKVYARAPRKNGVGLAVYNRLIRACAFQTIEPETRIIGLCGPTGSGKTSVSNALLEKGFAIIDCDKISRDNSTYHKKCLEQLTEAFGSHILENGILNRRKLAKEAFSSPEKTKLLNEITLPVIGEKINSEISNFKNQGKKFIVLDAPTLFEANADKICTDILIVTADENLRLERIIKRDNLSETEAKTRINAQKFEKFYTDRADYIIDTNSNSFDINSFIKYLNF